MLPLGIAAPAFALPEPASGKTVSLDDFKAAPALLVMFICNHCPFVKHIRTELARFARDYQTRDWPASPSALTMSRTSRGQSGENG